MTVHATDIVTPQSERNAVQVLHRKGTYRGLPKRLLDISVVLAILPFVLPFFAIIAAIISLDGSAPFFRQERVGKDGRRFRIWKFRTMVPNAEDLLEGHLRSCEKARREWNAMQKLSDDPRCTPVGRVLRRTSMDELPQIFNVLSGDMSLVGPRPMMVTQQALYPGGAYYRLRPGMTGPWQVSARNETRFADRAIYDDAYEAEMSLFRDLRIIARTFRVVLRGTGI